VSEPAISVRTLTDGGQSAADVATEVARFLGAAQRTLELALYDVRLPSPVAELVRGAIEDAGRRGVAVRLIYNLDHDRPIAVPPPPLTEAGLIESLTVPTRAIPGVPDLMHHKFAVRDGRDVWTGSTNWTRDSWEREENVVVVVTGSPKLARAYEHDFDELWQTREVARSGHGDAEPVRVGQALVRAWFTPGHGRELSHRIAQAIARARRVRIASPVITAGPILGTLAQVASDGRTDLAGVLDATQVHQVVRQWRAGAVPAWKLPALAAALGGGRFSGKRSTPYQPGSVHDYMHAKVTVCDDTVFCGSFNLSRSGELNAENVLEIEDRALATRLASFVDEVRARHPTLELPA